MFRFDYCDQPGIERAGRVRLSPAFFNEKDRTLELMTEWRAKPAPWAHDLVQIARAVYLVDKISPRVQAADRWSRDIDLRIQVHEADPWQPASDDLGRLVSMLTGDRWSITIVGGGSGGQQSLELGEPQPPEEVALFSGGLDSTAYLASRVRGSGDAKNVLAVSHFHNHEKQAQFRVWHALQRLAAPRQLDRIPFRQLPHVPDGFHARHNLGHENTTRSRGLLFAAAAIYTAAAHGAHRVAIPENGQLAINPPLAPNRVGGCSTRTVHPMTLYLLNRLVSQVGGSITVYNPLRHETKVEVCERAMRAGLTPSDLAKTLSCSRASSSQRSGGVHCGYCWACLVRRSALTLAVAGGDPTAAYRFDPWHVDSSERGKGHGEFMAVLYWLSQAFTVRTLAADLPLPPDAPVAEIMDVIERGRTDLRRGLAQLITPDSPYRERLDVEQSAAELGRAA